MCMDAKDIKRWRLCLLLAGLCAAYAITAATLVSNALAAPIDDDIVLAAQYLPQGHPCRQGIAVVWVPGLRNDPRLPTGGGDAGGAAPLGHLVGGQWLEQDITGQWFPLECYMQLEPLTWANVSRCEQRRIVFHEAGHLAGLDHDAGGIMSQDWMVRDEVPVPGCPSLKPSLNDRIVDRVLDRVPMGWGVSCGPRRGLVVRCRAELGRKVRRFRVRLADSAGSSFEVKRVR